jgi:RsiW-degrading membrane proteinase PrsW (M82 family)
MENRGSKIVAIVALCVGVVGLSLGFAAFENVMYLFSNVEDFLSVGFTRALFAVPGHFCDGVLMGYYYSKVRFGSNATTKDQIMVLGAPIILHGLYDAILFIIPVAPYVSTL